MIITGPELLDIARKGRPEVEYRLSKDHASIAAKVEGEWHRVACATITTPVHWFEMGDLLINGKKLPFEPDLTL